MIVKWLPLRPTRKLVEFAISVAHSCGVDVLLKLATNKYTKSIRLKLD